MISPYWDNRGGSEDYKAHFELCGNVKEWKDADKLLFFLTQLQGDAARSYRGKPDSNILDFLY